MMQREEAAWITGLGMIGPQGVGMDALEQSLREPRACFTDIPPLWSQTPNVPDTYIASLSADSEAALKKHETLSTDRACAMALCAAEQAWQQASCSADPTRAGVYWGTGMGGLHTTETSYQRLLVDRAPLRPMTVVRIMANSAAAQLAIKFGLQGPNHTYSMACASSAAALGEALLALRSGRIDVALVGGSEAMLLPGVCAAWGALRVLSTKKASESAELACRPFSSKRTGLVIGEGAAAFVLESPRHARARGARALAKLTGYGSTCDAASLVHPQLEGQVRAMRQALADSGLQAPQIGHVNAHATGTDAGDVSEAQALHEVFGSVVPPVCATKATHGHLLGAAGAMEAAIAIMSLQNQIIPATPGCEPLDARCEGINLCSTPRQASDLNAVMSNSFAFGGSNVSLIFERAGDEL